MPRQNFNRKPNFVQNFEDSQMAQSELNESQGEMEYQYDGQPIQLIRIKPSGKVQILPEALDIICSCDLPVGFVCLTGKYRTGKSFLLNKLLYLENKGFKVDPSTEACTQGIWMWSRPFKNERLNNYIFFLDTEGSQSLVKDAQNDTKIFVLSVLLSSYFIYNSFGSIDEKSISQLNLITKLSMNILAQENIRNSDNQQILYRYMPKFMWLIRDFTLQMRSADGRRLNSRQYMEDCLLQQNNLIKVNDQSKKIRRAITTYFKDRDCMTLVRPARQQNDLRRLDVLPEHALRRQFIESVNQLREKIMRQAAPKIYDNLPLYGSSIASMLENYVQAINNGRIPAIKTAWQHISQDQGAYAFNKALQIYHQLYEQNFSDDEPKGEQIHKILVLLRQQTTSEFNRNITQPNDAYQIKLKEFLSQKEQAILEVNKQLNECRNVQILKDCSANFMRKIEANAYEDNPEQLQNDYERIISDFKKEAKGESKGQILSEFTTKMIPIIIQLQRPKAPPQNLQKDRKKEQQSEQLQLMKKQISSLKSQLEASKQRQIQRPVPPKNSARPIDPKGKKKSTGCCGGEGCQIM